MIFIVREKEFNTLCARQGCRMTKRSLPVKCKIKSLKLPNKIAPRYDHDDWMLSVQQDVSGHSNFFYHKRNKTAW